MKLPKPTLIALGVVGFLFLLFVILNFGTARVHLIIASVDMPLAFVLILSTGFGIVIGLLAAYAWQVAHKPK